MFLRSLITNGAISKAIEQLLVRGFQLLLAVTIICVIVPFSPAMPSGGLDPSWVFGMNQAIAQGMVIGRDISFTFGPYASIYTKTYHPATDHLMLFGSLYFALSYVLVIFMLVRNSGWFLVFGFWLFLVGSLAADSLYFSYPLLVSVICFMVNGGHTEKDIKKDLRLTEIVILFLPLGLLPLIKGSFLIICAVAVGLVAISFGLRGKWRFVAVAIITPIISVIIFWSFSGQAIENVYFYFKSMAPIISGYTEAMATDGPADEIYLYILAVCVLLLVIISENDVPLVHRALSFFGFSAYFFISFKGGFVRHDGHALMAGTAVMFASFVMAFSYRSPAIFIVFALSFGAWINIDQNYAKTSTNGLLSRLESTYTSAWFGAKSRVTGSNELKLIFNEAIKKLNNQAKFPIFKGNTDIYSFNQAYLIASGNLWNPRPIFQSYSVYTSSLAQMNKEHLFGKNAPDNVIFRIEPIDGRLPSIEDGASWPALLNHYGPSAKSNDFLYLHRKNDSHSSDEIFLSSGTYSFGEIVSVPNESAPIFAEVLIKPSFIGRLVNIFYKPSQLQIVLELVNGKKVTYRLIAGMASSGFVLSPLIETTDEFGLLYGGIDYLDEKLVKSFSISPVDWMFQWAKTYEVTFKKISLSQKTDVSNIYIFDKLVGDIYKHKISLAAKCDGNIDELSGISPAIKSSVGGLIKVRGWLAKSVERGVVGDSVLLALRDSAGKYQFLSTKKVMRSDVGAHFKNPTLDLAGFVSTGYVGTLSGDYILGLAYTEGDQVRVCPQFNIPISFKGASAHVEK